MPDQPSASGPAFQPRTDPHCDFLITSAPNERLRGRMRAIGAGVSSHKGCEMFAWGFEPGESDFLGVGIAGGRFRIGPVPMEDKSAGITVGTCCIVAREARGMAVRPDPQGLCAIYVGPDFVTNSLHLAAIASPRMNAVASAEMFYTSSHIIWDQETTYDTYLEGVRLMPPFSVVHVGPEGVSVTQQASFDYEVVEPEAYRALIAKAAEEICSNVEAVLDAGLPVRCDITGGQDSRIVLGALIALGRVGEVGFITELTPNQWGEADQVIGSGLVKEFGGTYVQEFEPVGFQELGLQEGWDLRRSQIFGTYHSVRQTFMAPGRMFFRDRFVRIGGACGEIYRNAFPVMTEKFGAQGEFGPAQARRFFEKHMWEGFREGPADAVTAHMVEDFCALTGETLQQKVNSHHLCFRSRAHFRDKAAFHKSVVNFGPLFSPSLLRAVRGLPQAERDTGRAMFDITRELCERLPHFPFARAIERDYTASPYHRPSQFDGTVQALPDGLDLLAEAQRHRNAVMKPFRAGGLPAAERIGFFDGVIAQALTRLRDEPGQEYLCGPAMAALLEGCKKGDTKHLRMASKLQQMVDLLDISEEGARAPAVPAKGGWLRAFGRSEG